jgi:hypothetical protein
MNELFTPPEIMTKGIRVIKQPIVTKSLCQFAGLPHEISQ